MFRIHPTALYSKADLARLLGDSMTVETFLVRVGPHLSKPFKSMFYGQDLIEAIAALMSEGDGSTTARPASRSPRSTGRGRKANLIDVGQFS